MDKSAGPNDTAGEGEGRTDADGRGRPRRTLLGSAAPQSGLKLGGAEARSIRLSREFFVVGGAVGIQPLHLSFGFSAALRGCDSLGGAAGARSGKAGSVKIKFEKRRVRAVRPALGSHVRVSQLQLYHRQICYGIEEPSFEKTVMVVHDRCRKSFSIKSSTKHVISPVTSMDG